jgi:HlyD family secretion protein
MKFSFDRRTTLIAAAVGLVAILVLFVARSGPLASMRVTVAPAARADLAPLLFGIGVVEARRSYLVGPTTAGRVRHVAVDVGEVVKAGQLLAEMDPVDLDQRLAATSAAARRAKNAVDTAAAQLADSVARREVAAANARRYEELGRKGFVSSSVTEGKTQEMNSASAQFAAAEAALAGARQDLARLDAERAGAQQQRSNLRLLAPADGVVTARDAEPGSTVVAGQAVVRLVDPASLWLRVRFDQGRSAGLAAGLPAEIALRSRPGRPLAGKVQRLELLGDSVTEERIAQIAFEQMPEGIVHRRARRGHAAAAGRQGGPRPAQRQPAPARRRDRRLGGARRHAALHAAATGAADLDGNVEVIDGLQGRRPGGGAQRGRARRRQPHPRRRHPHGFVARDQPRRPRHPAFLGQVRLHRRRPRTADRRHPDHGRRLSRHGR